jgi:hypothetical protein
VLRPAVQQQDRRPAAELGDVEPRTAHVEEMVLDALQLGDPGLIH